MRACFLRTHTIQTATPAEFKPGHKQLTSSILTVQAFDVHPGGYFLNKKITPGYITRISFKTNNFCTFKAYVLDVSGVSFGGAWCAQYNAT